MFLVQGKPLLPEKLTCTLKIHGWSPCISYWNRPFKKGTFPKPLKLHSFLPWFFWAAGLKGFKKPITTRSWASTISREYQQSGVRRFTGWWQLKFWNFHPYLGKMIPFWQACFSKGLVQPPTRDGCICQNYSLQSSLVPLVQDYLNKHVQMMQTLPFFVAAIWWHYSHRSILTIV